MVQASPTSIDVVGAGLTTLDRIFYIPSKEMVSKTKIRDGLAKYMQVDYPEITKRKPIYLGTAVGGSTSNTLSALSILGLRTALISSVGDDVNGYFVEDELRALGITTNSIKKKRGATKQYSHLIDITSRTHRFDKNCPECGNEFPRATTLREKDLDIADYSLVSNARVLHIDRSPKYIGKLVDSAVKAKKIVSLDLGHVFFFDEEQSGSAVTKEIIASTQILKTGNQVKRQLEKTWNVDRFTDYLQKINPGLLLYVNTLGGEGIEGYINVNGEAREFRLPPPRVRRNVIDAGGAGDAFHAGLLYYLFKSDFRLDPDGYQEGLEFAQSLAYLACLLPGAKTYLFRALQEPEPSKALLEWINDIIRGNDVFAQYSDDDLINLAKSLYDTREQVPFQTSGCKACGPRNARTVYERNIDQSKDAIIEVAKKYWKNVGVVLDPENPAIVNQKLPFDPFSKDLVFFVGSGGSFSAAAYCEYVLHYANAKAIGKALTPNEYVNITRKSDATLLFSYSGRSDILPSLKRAIDNKESTVIITGHRKSKLARIAVANRVPVWYLDTKVSDIGFVSTIGMLSMMTLFTVMLKDMLDEKKVYDFFDHSSMEKIYNNARDDASKQSTHMLERLVQSDRQDEARNVREKLTQIHLVLLASGPSFPAAVDLEAKLTEGGICTSEISELKNYTHGRYINAYKNKDKRAFVVFSIPQHKKVVDFLTKKLGKEFPTVILETQYSDFRGTFELMIKSLYFSSFLSRQLGIDICKPKYPKEAKGLFSFNDIYTPASETLKVS
jgi:sugar/nucleoside kinase (ribokinase family)/fructoselysine-6-P-deglycase FrlB-like protein